MRINAYANLTTNRLSASLSGSSVITLPTFVQGNDINVALRFAETIDGAAIEVKKTLVGLKASVGFIDSPPTGGYFVLRYGAGPYVEGVNQTTPLPFDTTSLALDAALTDIGITDAKVVYEEGSWLISNLDAEIENFHGVSVAGDDALSPPSLVKIREIETSDEFVYDVRLQQTPLASTSSFTNIVPPPPTVARVQEGGESPPTVWPEIQSLSLPPNFRGIYQIRRGFKRTTELSLEDGPEEIEAALAAIADDEGSFRVTNPAANVAHISFLGSMSGIAQDLLEIVVFAAPEGDASFTLNLNTAEVYAALRKSPEIKPIFEIEAVIQDDNDEEITYVHTLHRGTVTLARKMHWDGLEVAAGINWLRPPYGISYVPFTPDQIINGTRNYVAPFGDGIAFTFEISHNLDSLEYLPPAIIDNSNGALLLHGTDYVITGATANTITVETLAVDAWPTDGLKLVLGLAGPNAAFQAHTHTIAQIVGLQTILDDLGERVVDLETLLPEFTATDDPVTADAKVAAWELPTLFEVYPTRQTVEAKDVSSIKLEDLPRAGGLLPAVYPTLAVEDVTELPPSPVVGTIYKNDDTEDIVLPGYLGRRSTNLAPESHFTWDGRGFYAVEKVVAADDVYYPVDFSRELFRVYVSEKQLRLKKSFVLDFSFIAAVFKSNVAVQWGVVIDIGIPSEDSGSSAPNLFDVEFLAPSLDQTFLITPVPSSHAFGIRVTRKLVDLVDTLLVDKVSYGALESTATGEDMPSANFVVRARLHRFDTQDGNTDPRGLVAFNGLKATLGEDEDLFGIASIN